MDIFLLYLWTRLDQISFTLGTLFLLCCGVLAASVLSRMFCFDQHEREESWEFWGPWVKKAIWVGGVILAINIIIPTQKQAAIILAGSAILDVAKSEAAGRIASKSVQLIEQTLDGYLKKDAK